MYKVVSIEELPPVVAVQTCVEQSLVCLVSDHKGPCLHWFCLLAYKKPQYFGISRAEFYSRREFSAFDLFHGQHAHPHLIPHNPGTTAKLRNDFEGFRQSQNAIIRIAGKWPTNLKVVSREHVEFRWTEAWETVPSFNYETGRNEWKPVLDVNEFAYYVGPTAGLIFHEVDVNEDHRSSTPGVFAAVPQSEKGGQNG